MGQSLRMVVRTQEEHCALRPHSPWRYNGDSVVGIGEAAQGMVPQ